MTIERLTKRSLVSTGIIALVAGLLFAAGCGRKAVSASTTSAAYSDGFEVVVFEMRGGAPVKVRSLPLAEAESAIAAGARAVMPGEVGGIESQLSAEKTGDFHAAVLVTKMENGKQRVRVSFHESKRTYIYEYVVDGTKITPVESEYRDLGESKVVRYDGK